MYHTIRRGDGGLEECLSGAGGEEMLQYIVLFWLLEGFEAKLVQAAFFWGG